jgi:hypothetical protein
MFLRAFAGDLESVQFDRDVHALLILMWATFREAVTVIDALNSATVGVAVPQEPSLRALQEFKRRWSKGDGHVHDDVRNKMGFHFDSEPIRKGMDAAPFDPGRGKLRLATGGGLFPLHVVGSFPFGRQLAFAGLGWRPENLQRLVEDTLRDHIDFAENVLRLFFAVLRKRTGIQLILDGGGGNNGVPGGRRRHENARALSTLRRRS